jgi:proline dehydrogenase
MGILNNILVYGIQIMPKPLVKQFAKNYIAGDSLNDAISVINKLWENNYFSTIDLLGEFVDGRFLAIKAKNDIIDDILTIRRLNLPTYHSLKLTQLGIDVDKELCIENLKEILTVAKQENVFVRIDMENTPYTTITLDIYKEMRKYFDNFGIVLQSYLYRTEQDIEELKDYKPNVRLVKGIYIEDKKYAIKDKQGIRNNYMKLLEKMIDYGYYVAIATHDDYLTNKAIEIINQKGITKDKFEFQMLLGVREKLREEIKNQGYKVTVYVPYGMDWYGYSIRRFKENPSVAMHVAKSIFHIT